MVVTGKKVLGRTLETLQGLQGVWSTVCTSEFEKLLFHAASLLASFRALRVSELVALSEHDRSGRALEFRDVTMQSQQLDRSDGER